MRILLTGATGFIGRRLAAALTARGHRLVVAGRRQPPPGLRWVSADFAATRPPSWSDALAGVDAVVNLAGVFRDQSAAPMDRVHRDGPIDLFDACVAAGVPRVVQVSALGADAQASTHFLRSKRAADDHLLALPLDATVVQPSLVWGPDGGSARLFARLAAAPVLVLPDGGRQVVQPVHVDDLVAALVVLVESPPGAWRRRRVALVGPRPVTLRRQLEALRAGLGLPPAPVLPVPAPVVSAAAGVADRWPALAGGLFGRDAWRMLRQGSRADPADTARLLGRPPRPVEAFVDPREAPGLRTEARLAVGLPLLRLAIAAVWIWTAVVSLGLHPVDDSFALLGRAGVPPSLRPAALIGAALLDLAFGLATLWPPRPPWRRRLWAAQALLIAGYTLVITLRLPEQWLHPFGPISKNLPILAGIALLALLDPPERARTRCATPDRRRWTT